MVAASGERTLDGPQESVEGSRSGALRHQPRSRDSSTRQKPAEWTNTAMSPTARNVTPAIYVMCQKPATIPTKAAAWAIE